MTTATHSSSVNSPDYLKALPQDLNAGLVVFLVALPLCLGVALASNVPMISGIIAGVVGGILVAWISGSHTSISGPAAGLTAIIAAQVAILGSVEALLVAVMLAGVMQMGMAAMKAGSLAAFFPSSVIKGLLAAIGVILILKQIPHLMGHDPEWFGSMSFQQADGENTFSELLAIQYGLHPSAIIIGFASLALLMGWDKTPLRRLPLPAPLFVVLAGVAMTLGLNQLEGVWLIAGDHLVRVPTPDSIAELFALLPSPEYSALADPKVWVAAGTIAIVASLETLLNLEAVDKLDTQKRVSPPNRELMAQGVGNMTSGFLGGIPITSVVVRSSVGISAGGMTKMTCFIHGVLLLGTVLFIPQWLNLIPLSCLAAILIVTGFKLASPKIFKEMWAEGKLQFLPFVVTIVAIVLTDLLVGIVIGMIAATVFILHSNLKNPLRMITERHVGGEVLRIELANQLTFLNRAHLFETLHAVLHGSQVVLDASDTVYMDPDISSLLHEFENEIAPAHNIDVSLLGFKEHYEREDSITYADVTTREIQGRVPPAEVLQLLLEGNQRFVDGQPINRDPRRQVDATAEGQHPLAVVLACMDSRVATERLFDVGLGDLFSLRVAGNIVSNQQLGSMEYGCAVAGAKLILVMGHTRCGAISATVDQIASGDSSATQSLENLSAVTAPIADCVRHECSEHDCDADTSEGFINRITERNVRRSMDDVVANSSCLRQLIDNGEVMLAGAIYDVETGKVTILKD